MIDENNISRGSIKNVSDIEPGKYYLTSHLMMTLPNGKIWTVEFSNARKRGLIKHLKPASGVGKYFLGCQVIDLFNRLEKGLALKESGYKEMADLATTPQIIELLRKNEAMKVENKRLLKLEQEYIAGIERNKLLGIEVRKLKDDAEIDASKAIKLIKNEVDHQLFGDECVLTLKDAHLNECGVYFLVKTGTIIYIGQSRCLFNRLSQHKAHKDFDEVKFIRCEQSELNEKEMFFIKLLKPELNGEYKNTPDPGIDTFVNKVLQVESQ